MSDFLILIKKRSLIPDKYVIKKKTIYLQQNISWQKTQIQKSLN